MKDKEFPFKSRPFYVVDGKPVVLGEGQSAKDFLSRMPIKGDNNYLQMEEIANRFIEFEKEWNNENNN